VRRPTACGGEAFGAASVTSKSQIERSADATAWSEERHERVAHVDRDISSGRRGGGRSGTSRSKGRTRDQLYDDARRLNIEGRSKMTKEQLQRAVAGR
jgi:hypothetical protein